MKPVEPANVQDKWAVTNIPISMFAGRYRRLPARNSTAAAIMRVSKCFCYLGGSALLIEKPAERIFLLNGAKSLPIRADKSNTGRYNKARLSTQEGIRSVWLAIALTDAVLVVITVSIFADLARI